MGRSTPTSGTVIPTPITGAGVRSCAARGSVNAATAQSTTSGVALIGPFRSGVRVGAEDEQCVRRLFSRASPSTIYARRQLQALVRRLHRESCERSVLSPYLQQRNLVIDQDETVRDLNRATRKLAAESCSHRHGGLVLDSVQRLYGILVLGLRVLLPGLYRVQTPNCATLIVHHRVCGKAIR